MKHDVRFPSPASNFEEDHLWIRENFKQETATTVVSSLGAKLSYGDAAASLHRALRHTGEKVSLIGVGGYHIGMASDEEESIGIVRTALDSKTASPVECLHHAMNLPTRVVITGCESLPERLRRVMAKRTLQSLPNRLRNTEFAIQDKIKPG